MSIYIYIDFMDYIHNKETNRAMPIGGRTFNKLLRKKLTGVDCAKQRIVLSNIGTKHDYKKIKPSLPKLKDSQFYYYDHNNKNVIVKNKSVKNIDMANLLYYSLPLIMDKVADMIDEDLSRDETMYKLKVIFYDTLLY